MKQGGTICVNWMLHVDVSFTAADHELFSLSQGGVNPGVFRVNDVNLLSHFAISRSFRKIVSSILCTCYLAGCSEHLQRCKLCLLVTGWSETAVKPYHTCNKKLR